ncbi:histone-lysine N-methyltransferase SET9 protein [Rutstroemia sp. NJR-2017a BBW]|nr:histone-lysine N-methyltransferase SET9 protein [Rutstroemia sp. NJR-2017a BBW]
MPPKASAAKKERLTLAQLCSYDDILTDALVDQVYYWTKIRKNRSAYHSSRGIREEDVTKILQNAVIIEKNTSKAESQLLELPGLKKFHLNLKTEKEKEDFRRHLKKYINIYLPDCPFEVSSTNRYTMVTHEASVVARRDINKGEVIKYLCGVQVIMTPEEEAHIGLSRRDFSIVISSRNKTASLFLGPARFANHDCDANARLMTTGNAGMQIIAVRDIDIGEEITVTYGDNYFGEDNCECLCRTCEEKCRNGWALGVQGDDASVPKLSIEQEPSQHDGPVYQFRRRRRLESSASSQAESMTPDINLRPHVPKSTLRSTSSIHGLSPGLASPLSNSQRTIAKRSRGPEDNEQSPTKSMKRASESNYEYRSSSNTPKKRRSSRDIVDDSPSSQLQETMRKQTMESTLSGMLSKEQVIAVDKPVSSATLEETTNRRSPASPHSIRSVIKQETHSVYEAPSPFGTPMKSRLDVMVKVEEHNLEIAEPIECASSVPSSVAESQRESFSPPSSAEAMVDTDATSVDDDTIVVEEHKPVSTSRPKSTVSIADTTSENPPPPKRSWGGRRRGSVWEAEKKARAEAMKRAKVSQEETPKSTVSDDQTSVLSELGSDLDLDDSTMSVVERASRPQKRRRKGTLVPPTTDLDHAPSVRIPGDYVLTPALLAEPASAWINCKICEDPFVQKDAYFTRSSCPRCERHSKLYGYMWPKTDKEGKHDEEERVTDHRTVHRFINFTEERMIRKRNGRGSTDSRDTKEASVVAAERKEDVLGRRSSRSRVRTRR